MQKSLFNFDSAKAKQAAQKGMDIAIKQKPPTWRLAVLDIIKEVASRKAYLTADDIWEVIQERELDFYYARIMGPLMVQARNNGWIEPTDRLETSRRISLHGSPRRVWKSLIYSPNEE